MTTFEAWPKTPRLFRDVTITEKLDGTNACIVIEEAVGDLNIALENVPAGFRAVVTDGAGPPDFEGSTVCFVGAQSRKRLITPDDDNYGFARWVQNNANDLVRALGPGRHFGEWFGNGIQRGYGLGQGDKRFALFNTARHSNADGYGIPGLTAVPVMYVGRFSEVVVRDCVESLRDGGSNVNGFANPEGVCVFHHAGRQVFKVTLENDEMPKGSREAESWIA